MIISTTKVIAFKQATISNSAVTLTTALKFVFTAAQIDASSRARISCDTQPVRYRYDGTAPDANTGHILPTNTTIELLGNANIRALQFIRQGGSDGTVSITLEG